VLWGGLLEAVTAVIVARRSPTWADQLLRERSNDHKLAKLWGDLKPRYPVRDESFSAQRAP